MSKQTKKSTSLQLRGKVIGFNINPKGTIDGALVETPTGMAQLNFPKRHSEEFARSMQVGSEIDLNAELDTDKGGHPVYWVGSKEATITGTITRLNYSLDGAVNGYQLEGRIFLHVKPDGARRYDLHVGEAIEATGTQHPGMDAVVMDVRSIERTSEKKLQPSNGRAPDNSGDKATSRQDDRKPTHQTSHDGVAQPH